MNGLALVFGFLLSVFARRTRCPSNQINTTQKNENDLLEEFLVKEWNLPQKVSYIHSDSSMILKNNCHKNYILFNETKYYMTALVLLHDSKNSKTNNSIQLQLKHSAENSSLIVNYSIDLDVKTHPFLSQFKKPLHKFQNLTFESLNNTISSYYYYYNTSLKNEKIHWLYPNVSLPITLKDYKLLLKYMR